MKDPCRAKGRTAHEGHLCKVGQAWKEDSVQVFVEDPANRSYRLFDMPEGNRECEKCGEVIRYDELGVAFCQCPNKNVWNEAVVVAPKKSPFHNRSHLNRLMDGCKA